MANPIHLVLGQHESKATVSAEDCLELIESIIQMMAVGNDDLEIRVFEGSQCLRHDGQKSSRSVKGNRNGDFR